MITLTVSPVLVMTVCDTKELKEMHQRFSVCTMKYRERYSNAMAVLEDSESEGDHLIKVTCQLVDSLVGVCGDTWNSCHTAAEVSGLKQMYVESLRKKNENASISIEDCDSIKNIK